MKKLIIITVSLMAASVSYSQSVSVAPTKMNVLFKGVDNPLRIVVEGQTCEDVVVKASSGKITGDTCNYTYRLNDTVQSTTTISITIGVKVGVYSDWSLPTYWACHDMGLSTSHWSSSELDATQAYAFSGSVEIPTNKSTLLAVRAVRQFTY